MIVEGIELLDRRGNHLDTGGGESRRVGIEIDADPATGRDRVEEVAIPRADVEYGTVGRYIAGKEGRAERPPKLRLGTPLLLGEALGIQVDQFVVQIRRGGVAHQIPPDAI